MILITDERISSIQTGKVTLLFTAYDEFNPLCDRILWNIFNEVRAMIKIKVTFANGIRYAEAETTSAQLAIQAAQARYIAASEFSVVSIEDENYRDNAYDVYHLCSDRII